MICMKRIIMADKDISRKIIRIIIIIVDLSTNLILLAFSNVYIENHLPQASSIGKYFSWNEAFHKPLSKASSLWSP